MRDLSTKNIATFSSALVVSINCRTAVLMSIAGGPLSLLLLPCPTPSKMSRNLCTAGTTPPPPSALREPPPSSFMKPPSSPPPPLPPSAASAPGRSAASVSWPCGTG